MTRATSKVVVRAADEAGAGRALAEAFDLLDFQRLLPSGGCVVIKLNLSTTDPQRAKAANTDAAVIDAVCGLVRQRTPRILLGEADNLRQTADEAFKAAGCDTFVEKYEVRLTNFSRSPGFAVSADGVPGLALPVVVREADCFITLPVLKTHGITYFTGALKNQWGCVTYRDRIHWHRWLDRMLVLVNAALPPTLSVMDGIVGMEGRGPVGGNARRANLLLASRDPVALDAVAIRVAGLKPERCRHLHLAAAAGLGNAAGQDIDIDGGPLSLAQPFAEPPRDLAIAFANYLTRYPFFVNRILANDTLFRLGKRAAQAMRRVSAAHV